MTALIDRIRRLRHTCLPLRLKYGRRFRQVFELLMQHQQAGREELEAYQWQQLKKLLDYAYVHVPFYRERFTSIGLHPDDIKTRAHYRQIPILTKEDVAANPESLKSDEFARHRPVAAVTSATTRDQVRFFRSAETEVWRNAMTWRHYFNVGYRFREPRVELAGMLGFLDDPREMPLDYNENAVLIDLTSVSFEHSPEIYERIKAFEPKLIYCHPGATTTLVEYWYEHGLEPLRIPLIRCVGEKIWPEYREAITGFFQGRLIEYYGNRENTAAATELPDGRMYAQSDYCCLEFINEDGEEDIGKQGDIISTSLVNYAFPFIRYDTDDVGINHGHPEDATCNFPVVEIVGGRGKDLILTKRGLICTYVPLYVERRGFHRFKRVQLVQPTIEELVFNFVPTDGFRDPEDREFLERVLDEQFEGEFKVTIRLVDEIPPTEGCKNRKVISEPAVKYLRERQQLRREI